ncbi:MAG: hypothetical protein DRH30_00870 [Deltaproteobacteria bacterium]|nr:MAG: hypothetical protein DRH30_00870 [Deltaproteobacteria bacterium]
MTDFREKFREAYSEMGASKLAARIGVARKTVYRWEQGSTPPRTAQERTLRILNGSDDTRRK